MRYLVVELAEGEPDGGEEVPVTKCKSVHPCSNEHDVALAIGQCQSAGDKWEAFRKTDSGRFQKVSVVFDKDGHTVKKIA